MDARNVCHLQALLPELGLTFHSSERVALASALLPPRTMSRHMYCTLALSTALPPRATCLCCQARWPEPRFRRTASNPWGNVEHCSKPHKVSVTSQFGTPTGVVRCSMPPEGFCLRPQYAGGGGSHPPMKLHFLHQACLCA